MRDYIVELVATLKKQMIVTAVNAEEASKIADIIIRKTDLISFDNDDVALIEVEISPDKETDYSDNDVHFGEVKPKPIKE